MKKFFGFNGTSSSNNNSNDNEINQEVVSYQTYKNMLKNGELQNIKEIKMKTPSIRSKSRKPKVQITYKKPKKKKKTKRVVHDPRFIKMDHPN